MSIFNLFKRKEPKTDKYLFYREIRYKGETITVYAKLDEERREYYGDSVRPYYNTYRKTSLGGGCYYSGGYVENIEKSLIQHVEAAKKFIDTKLNEPEIFKTAFEKLNNLEL